eukprot:GGOE01065098.1.p1 GENE.GGOE01065098.1~~GGOE01065098.1.p1  ORF type:complete len:159 (+),score=46.79 GGOE01065098.1:34-477(+)
MAGAPPPGHDPGEPGRPSTSGALQYDVSKGIRCDTEGEAKALLLAVEQHSAELARSFAAVLHSLQAGLQEGTGVALHHLDVHSRIAASLADSVDASMDATATLIAQMTVLSEELERVKQLHMEVRQVVEAARVLDATTQRLVRQTRR